MSAKLTAEQVREAHDRHWHDLPAEYDMPEASALPEYSYDWQAIADELNAALGGECENVSDEPQYFQCSECSSRGIVRKVFDNRTKFSFCPDCGAKVRKAVKR